MVKLLIIADDFTGALDTGVQFAKQGVKTLVTTDTGIDIQKIDFSIEVLVVDTETRHMTDDDAYKTVYSLVKKSAAIGIKHIYKKTDSVLRGNIGSELLAAMDGTGGDKLMFIPAYPDNGRTTVDGVQYVSGVPIAESHFARDPFNPVISSYIPDIIKQYTDVDTIVVKQDEAADLNRFRGILIFDAKTNDEMTEIGQKLSYSNQLKLTAGCAGFAGILCSLLDFKESIPGSFDFGDTVLVISGSVNKTSLDQMDHFKEAGFKGITLTDEHKLNNNYHDNIHLKELVGFIKNILKQKKTAYIEAVGNESDIIDANQLIITKNIGTTVKQILDDFPVDNLFIIGGDTLFGIMENLGITHVIPMLELSPGIALSKAFSDKYSFNLITKSGGFGNKDAVTNILSRLIIYE